MVLACSPCNQIKTETIPAADVHYEHLALKTVPGDESFPKEFDPYFRLAVRLKSQAQCMICHASVASHGPMRAARIDTTQPWHYLNVGLFCEKHFPAKESTD